MPIRPEEVNRQIEILSLSTTPDQVYARSQEIQAELAKQQIIAAARAEKAKGEIVRGLEVDVRVKQNPGEKPVMIGGTVVPAVVESDGAEKSSPCLVLHLDRVAIGVALAQGEVTEDDLESRGLIEGREKPGDEPKPRAIFLDSIKQNTGFPAERGQIPLSIYPSSSLKGLIMSVEAIEAPGTPDEPSDRAELAVFVDATPTQKEVGRTAIGNSLQDETPNAQ